MSKKAKDLLFYFGMAVLFVLHPVIVGTSIVLHNRSQGIDTVVRYAVHDTIYVHDTTYIDTCDSQFMRAIMEIETGAISRVNANDATLDDPITTFEDSIEYRGPFMISNIYFLGTRLSTALQYDYSDVYRTDGSYHCFWAMTGILAHLYYKDTGKEPTFEDLARMHNGGPKGYLKESTLEYARRYRKHFNRALHYDYIRQQQ